MDVKLSKNFSLSDIVGQDFVEEYRLVSVNILEPIQQRFGKIILQDPDKSRLMIKGEVKFRVEGFDKRTIIDYISNNLIHTFINESIIPENEWIGVSCRKET